MTYTLKQIKEIVTPGITSYYIDKTLYIEPAQIKQRYTSMDGTKEGYLGKRRLKKLNNTLERIFKINKDATCEVEELTLPLYKKVTKTEAEKLIIKDGNCVLITINAKKRTTFKIFAYLNDWSL